jgi:hypothetical protein
VQAGVPDSPGWSARRAAEPQCGRRGRNPHTRMRACGDIRSAGLLGSRRRGSAPDSRIASIAQGLDA